MRRFISYLAFAFTLAVMVGCVKTDDITSDHQGMVTLKLSNNTLITTRATTSADEKALNEFWIDEVQCFFTTDDNTIVYASDLITIADDDKNGSADLNLIIPSSAMTTLFSGTGNVTPKIYVVANVGTKIEAETIDAVKEQAITLEAYKADAEASADAVASAQSKFVMDSALTAIKKSDNSIVTSDGKAIDLIRAAAKIQVQVNINKSITVGEGEAAQTWTPDLSSIEMTYNRSVTSSKLSATAADATARASYAQKSKSDDFTFAGTEEGSTATSYTLTQNVPFYSYPSSWANTEDNEAYISLLIPWAKNNGTSYLTYSYQIPVNFNGKQLERNHLYQLNVDVGVLGTLEGEVELTPSYVVVDWGTGEINAALSSPRYLVVDKNKLEIYNQSTVSVGYNSSHAVTATIDRIEFNSYRLANTRTITITSNSTTINPASNKITVTDRFTDYKIPTAQTASLAEGQGTLDFSHAVPTNYVPHTIYVTLRHTDNASFSQQIEIVQYPPIYMKNDPSNGRVYINGSRSDIEDDNGNSLGSLAGDVTGNDEKTNDNTNMYNIYISVLPASSSSILGDPRVATGSTLYGIESVTNYRPTRQGAENIIAPAFKIASSWGKTTDLGTYAAAERRCAAYQESGYPAGRWRVPTPAEIAFIQERSANNEIPSLFNGDVYDGRQYSGYWTSYGLAYWPGYETPGTPTGPAAGAYNTTEVNCSKHAVRCVYDIWYWGEDRVQSALQSAQWGDNKTNDQF
ncbi:MAG: hypothetical protein IJ431_02230 [Alistipes sp.]|nr:hypothetical protein [Alistipes sp.]